MNRFAVSVAATVVICLCVGCSQTSPKVGTDPQGLGTADNGRTITVAPNQIVRITLESNPTTGYSWRLASLDTSIIERTRQEYVGSESKAAGAGGKEVWTFTARSAGRAKLRLEYVRPWEKDVAPVKTFEITIIVK